MKILAKFVRFNKHTHLKKLFMNKKVLIFNNL